MAEAPCCGVRSVFTPGVMTANERKLRPSMGRLSICCRETTEATTVRCASSSGPGAETVMVSAVPETFRTNDRSTREPRASVTPGLSSPAKPESVADTS